MSVYVRFMYKCKRCGEKYCNIATTADNYSQAYNLLLGEEEVLITGLPKFDTHICFKNDKKEQVGLAELVGMNIEE